MWCALATDKDSLAEFMSNIDILEIRSLTVRQINSAIMTSINRLKDNRTKSRIIILVVGITIRERSLL
jgi:hypothetical protein